MAIESAGLEIAPIPEQGQLVVVRQRTYVVTNINQSTVSTDPSPAFGVAAQHLLTLSSIEDDALGEELQDARGLKDLPREGRRGR